MLAMGRQLTTVASIVSQFSPSYAESSVWAAEADDTEGLVSEDTQSVDLAKLNRSKTSTFVAIRA